MLRLNYIEAGLGSVLVTLGASGSIFVTGFALALGATGLQIGILAALPAFAGIVQLLGSYLMERLRTTKGLCLVAYYLFTALWGATVAAPLVVFRGALEGGRLPALLVGILLVSVAQALLNVSWMAWKAAVIPEAVRGKFFGTRNMVAGLTGMVATLAAGRFLDFWDVRFALADAAVAYAIVFGSGIVLSLLAAQTLQRVTDAPPVESSEGGFWSQLAAPVRDRNFRLFILFGAAWGFAVGVPSPFFNVFMLQDLSMGFSLIAALGLASGLANMGGMAVWGRLSDLTGPKPLYLVCLVGVVVMTLGWVIVTPGSVWLLWPLYLMSGTFWSGIALVNVSMMMGLAPSGRSGPYFAVYAAAAGITSAVAPIVGGYLLPGIERLQIAFAPSPIQVLFLLSAAMRLACLPLLAAIRAPAKMQLGEMLRAARELRRLQPNRGSGWGAGMAAMENASNLMGTGAAAMEGAIERALERTARAGRVIEDALFRVDRSLDERAGRWESLVTRGLDRVWPLLQRLLRWLADEDADGGLGTGDSGRGEAGPSDEKGAR